MLTLLITRGPGFMVVSPTAAVPAGLGSEGNGGVKSTHTALFLGLGGTALALALVSGAVALRRRAGTD